MPSDLAKRLKIAFISHRLGISMGYAEKKYANEPVDPFWIELAEVILERWSDYAQKTLKIEPPSKPN